MSTLDRDAARAVIRQATGYVVYDKTLDALEECVRPTGVTLTAAEAAKVLMWQGAFEDRHGVARTDDDLRRRLEATP